MNREDFRLPVAPAGPSYAEVSDAALACDGADDLRLRTAAGMDPRPLSAETGETATIVAPAGTMCVFIDVLESSAAIRYFAQIGQRVPIHATSRGRALLLQYSLEERNLLNRKIEFKQYEPSTPISIDAVEAELRTSIERGYCESFVDYSPDLAGVAKPLRTSDRCLSVVVAGPEFRMRVKIVDFANIISRSIERHSPATNGRLPTFMSWPSPRNDRGSRRSPICLFSYQSAN